MMDFHERFQKSSTKKTIVITMGDPLGVGPEVICRSLLKDEVRLGGEFVIVGDELAFARVQDYKKVLSLTEVSFLETGSHKQDPGSSEKEKAGRSSFEAIKMAVKLLKSGQGDALVTAPICKEHIYQAGFSFPGHTEYFCHEFHVKKFAMMLFHDQLRVVLATIHQPLKDIFGDITISNIFEKLEITAKALQSWFGITHPRIAVCGLNPHAGEHGLIGREEQDIILPAIEKFQKIEHNRAVQVFGPEPADTVFVKALSHAYDAVLCLYHDQALIPIKTTGFKETVNLTLGLPFVRTSPAHGTAFDIVGQNKADPTSMMKAIQAAKMLSQKASENSFLSPQRKTL